MAGKAAYTALGSNGSQSTPSWLSGEECTKEWSDYLHGYKAQWFWLVVLYCTPPGLIFCYSLVRSVIYGSWWNTSMNEPYEPVPSEIGTKYNPAINSLPAILKTHMTFAVPMLGGIVLQLIFAYLMVMKGNSAATTLHKRFGVVLLVIILSCVSLGTLSLGFCDIQGKRGAETVFFVAIGIGIMISGVRGISFAAQGFHGLHMQYMVLTICLIFTPGFNRITSVLIRHFYSAFQSGYSQQCFVASSWSPAGYYWTWSFILGFLYLAILWLCPCSPAKVPFFKIYGLGFFYTMLMLAILLSCLFQMFVLWLPDLLEKLHGLDCSENHLAQFKAFAAALRNRSMYDISWSNGLCTASSASEQVDLFGNLRLR